jgi:uncharacterized protein YgfB (UPF0149 family)
MSEIFNFDASGEWAEKIEHVLRQLDHELSAAEFHGTLTGLVCVGHSDRNIDQWQELLVGKSKAQPLLDAMHDLMALTERSLESPDFSFQPIFCSVSSLPERTHALGDWCRGFTLGIGWSDKTTVTSFGEDATEALSDIAYIALAEPGTDPPETEEKALVELEEFLRVSVQLIYEESCSSQLPSCATNLFDHERLSPV